MKDFVSQQIKRLDVAKTGDEIKEIIESLAKVGASAVPEILSYIYSLRPQPVRRGTLLKVFKQMGYPANRDAIKFIVSEASNINSTEWEIALEALIEIGETAIPEVQEALKFYMKNIDDNRFEIQGLCILIERMDSPLIDSLLPELIYLLKTGNDDNHVDEYALWAIRKIGSPKANTAVPILSKIIQSRRSEIIRKAAIDALEDFDISVIRPLHNVLINCLSADSDPIQNSARKILVALEKSM